MNATLRRATPKDIPAICSLLHTYMNPAFPIERWKNLFTPNWCVTKPDIGLVAEDNGNIVGFHGHVCSSRTVDSYRERFINFTSWYIRKEYRKNGLGSAMLEMATSDPDTTYTVFSLSPKRVEFFKTLGLEVLDEERLLWRKRGVPYDNLELTLDADRIQRRVTPAGLKVLEDHFGLPVVPALVSTRCSQCLLLLSIAQKKDDVTYYDVLYRSNPELFSIRTQDIAEALLPNEGCVLAADQRLVDGGDPRAEIEPITSPRFYKSARVVPREIDLAYSELMLLDLKLD